MILVKDFVAFVDASSITTAENGNPAAYRHDDLAGARCFYEQANEPKWTRTVRTQTTETNYHALTVYTDAP